MTPILYSFRRCPYAIRARLAIQSAGSRVELREVVLRDKPEAFLAVSPSATVPCLEATGTIIDESLDLMKWALEQNDPQNWLSMPDAGHDWITRNDGPFKHALDRTKYASRYPDEDAAYHRADALGFLTDLDAALDPWLFDHPTLADYAIAPFVRQFAFIDKAWFDAQPLPNVHTWLKSFLASEDFSGVMGKYDQWHPNAAPIHFPN